MLEKVFLIFIYCDLSRCIFLDHKQTKICRPTQHCKAISHSATCIGWHEPSSEISGYRFQNKCNNLGTSDSCNYPVSQTGTDILKLSAAPLFRVKKTTWCYAAEYKNLVSFYLHHTYSKSLLNLLSPSRYLLSQLTSHIPQAILCVGTRMYGRVFKSKPCLLWGTCRKKLMLIEFLHLAVNLTPSLKSPSIPQTPTHRLPAQVERSSDESAATWMYVGAANRLRNACRGIDIRFPARPKVLFLFPSDSSKPASYSTGNWRSSDSFASSSDVQNDQGYASKSSYAFRSFKVTNYRLKGHGSNFENDTNIFFWPPNSNQPGCTCVLLSDTQGWN
jgi:hypothetical protein